MDLNPSPNLSSNVQPLNLPQRKPRVFNSRAKWILLSYLVLDIGLLASFFLSSSACSNLSGTKPCVRVLFVGNSFTSVNNLPAMFAAVAKSGGHPVQADMVAPGGWTLANHEASSDTQNKMKSAAWDYVILQEQSQIPASDATRTTGMYPAARLLVNQIQALHATPIFFQTWAHSSGWPEVGLKNYQDMQIQIDYGYQQIADELSVSIAPAGYTWLMARIQDPDLNLWQDDGYHPNQLGTYLAACVFYAAIFRQSPAGLAYQANLAPETAKTLQTLAANAVLNNLEIWNLQ